MTVDDAESSSVHVPSTVSPTLGEYRDNHLISERAGDVPDMESHSTYLLRTRSEWTKCGCTPQNAQTLRHVLEQRPDKLECSSVDLNVTCHDMPMLQRSGPPRQSGQTCPCKESSPSLSGRLHVFPDRVARGYSPIG